MVFYRKYRPQTIGDLDLDEVREKLENILKAKELPHAFLFTGPKGLGKTSAARILAKAINCENRKTENGKRKTDSRKQKTDKNLSSVLRDPSSVISPPFSEIEPCNKCDACVSITNGSSIDVLEIDAASNRGIDEIRSLREKIKFSPAAFRKKVYIIDEVHMLTADAFNALLKTLEEPPAHALFILCTTEEDKVPATIKSRTFHVEFKKPKKEELLRSLERIIRNEKIEIDKEVPDMIYKLSEGSFRDGAKILEELSFLGGKITKEKLESKFKTGSIEGEVLKLLEALSKKDVKESVGIIEKLFQKGADFKHVTEKIAETLHSVLLARAGITPDVLDLPGMETQEIKKLLDIVNESYRDIKFSVLPQIPLELVAIGWCLEENQKSQPKADPPLAEKIKNQKEGKAPGIESREEGAKAEGKDIPSSVIRHPSSDGGMFKEGIIEDNFFAALISRVKQDNHSIAGILRGCKLIELSPDAVKFETAYKFHRDKLSDPKVREILDSRSSELLSRNVNVIVNLIEKKI